MKIACTTNAADLIQTPILKSSVDKSPFFSWHAHVYMHRRRKIFVLINDFTGFPVILYRPRAAQLKNFESVAEAAIRESFLAFGIKPEHVNRYFEATGPIVVHRKTSRSVLGHMTQWKNELMARLDSYTVSPFVDKQLTQPAFARQLMPACWTNYKHCEDLLVQGFQDVLNINETQLFAVESYELKLELKLNNHEVIRRVLLPANATLNRLHQLIQLVFGWMDSHLHQFMLLPQGASSLVSPVKLHMVNAADPTEECLKDVNHPRLIDVSTTIKEALSQQCDLWYEYDFGDSWQHKITLEKVCTLPARQYRLLESTGVCPPDDVGGEGGYEEFNRILADENHPSHDDIRNWFMAQTAHRMSFDEINATLATLK